MLNEEAQTVTFSYKDQKTPVIEQTAAFENDRQKVEVSVVKQDAENETVVAGAEFGLYAKEDILAHGEVVVKADTLLGKAVSNEDGKAVFELDLPFGSYYIKEFAAPAGYVSSFETLEVTAKYQGQDVKVVKLESVFKNQPTKVTFKKSDITTGVELSGATESFISLAITTEKDAESKSTEMGRKSIVPYGLYRAEGYVSANLARKVTGFSEEDLDLLWEAIINMFEHDHSAARGNMAVRELIVFKHSKELGDCPAYKLFDSVEVRRKEEVEYPRSYKDYIVEVHEENIPDSVEMKRMI